MGRSNREKERAMIRAASKYEAIYEAINGIVEQQLAAWWSMYNTDAHVVIIFHHAHEGSAYQELVRKLSALGEAGFRTSGPNIVVSLNLEARGPTYRSYEIYSSLVYLDERDRHGDYNARYSSDWRIIPT